MYYQICDDNAPPAWSDFGYENADTSIRHFIRAITAFLWLCTHAKQYLYDLSKNFFVINLALNLNVAKCLFKMLTRMGLFLTMFCIPILVFPLFTGRFCLSAFFRDRYSTWCEKLNNNSKSSYKYCVVQYFIPTNTEFNNIFRQILKYWKQKSILPKTVFVLPCINDLLANGCAQRLKRL